MTISCSCLQFNSTNGWNWHRFSGSLNEFRWPRTGYVANPNEIKLMQLVMLMVFLMRETELNKGNLSSHLAKLEQAGYVEIEKTYRGKVPQTLLRLTRPGRAAFDGYRRRLNSAFVEHLQALSAASDSARVKPSSR